MYIENIYRERAAELHRSCPVADAHLDLAAELYFRVKSGEENPLRERYLANLRAGGVNLVVSSVFLFDHQLIQGGLHAALAQIGALLEQVDKNREFFLVRTAADLEETVKGERIGILLYMEGLDCIGNDISLLRILWELGVRGASLTWSRRNALGDGCCRGGQRIQIQGGLSEAGFQAVREMERLGMFLDVSHLNDDGFEDVCRAAKKPFIATHSDCRDVFFHYRNLSDGQMKRLAAQEGMLGLNGCKCIIGCREDENGLELLCRHAEHAVAVMDPDRVGYGFDFCDALSDSEPGFRTDFERKHREDINNSGRGDCLGDHSHIRELTAALLQRGMKEETVKKLIGANWIEYFKKVLP